RHRGAADLPQHPRNPQAGRPHPGVPARPAHPCVRPTAGDRRAGDRDDRLQRCRGGVVMLDGLAHRLTEVAPATRRPWWRRALASSDAVAGAGALLLLIAFAVLQPDKFATFGNFRNLALDASLFLILASAQTFVVITGGIDLSIGALLVLTGVLAVK